MVIILLLCANALPALAAQQGPENMENVLVTCYYDAEIQSGTDTTLQIKVDNEAGQLWSSVLVRIDPQETAYLSPDGTNIIDFQSLTVGESRTEDKVVSIADTAPSGEYHFNIYVQLDEGDWTFLMLVTLQNTQGIDIMVLALALGITLVVIAAIGVVLITRRSSRRSSKRTAASQAPPKKKKRRFGRGPQIVSVRPRGEEAPPMDLGESITEVDESEEEIL